MIVPTLLYIIIILDGENKVVSSDGRPPKKRSRLLGDLDLESEDVQKLLKSRSSHDNTLKVVRVCLPYEVSKISTG